MREESVQANDIAIFARDSLQYGSIIGSIYFWQSDPAAYGRTQLFALSIDYMVKAFVFP